MKTHRPVLFGIIAFLAIIWSLESSAQGPADGPPGRYIVALKPGVQPADVAAHHGLAPEHSYRHALNGFAGVVPRGRLKALRGDPRVAWVEADRVVSYIAPLAKANSKPPPPQPSEVTPTGVNRIDAELNPRTDVSSIGIAIIDTGIDTTHPDLNVAGNVTFVSGTKNGKDDNGHGTHVAGIAAAKKNGIGVVGVAPNAKLYAVKVLDRSGNGWLSWIIAGINWVTQNAAAKNIRVANMSLGGQFTSASLNTAIHNSIAAGVTYVVAAGNDAMDAASFSPANHPEVITVSAIADSDGACGGLGASTSYGADDTFATFSNYGSLIEIASPGVRIYSTYKGGAYATLSGTSMSSPHVAGAAAQYLATDPGATPAQVAAVLISVGTPQSDACGFSGDPDTFAEPLVDAAGL